MPLAGLDEFRRVPLLHGHVVRVLDLLDRKTQSADVVSLRKVKGVPNSLALAAYMSPITPVGTYNVAPYKWLMSPGVICAIIVPAIITRFPGHQIFLVSMVSFFLGNLLAAVNPSSFGYWPITFPSLLVVIPGPGGP